jgi:MFS family permease
MIMPILPLFIESLGGSGIVIGLIGGLSICIASLLKILSGFWSDRVGRRKPFVVAGYSTSSVSKLGMAFSTAWHHVLILQPLERVGKGLRTAPRDAILAASAPRKGRGRIFGIHRAMDSAGAIVGSLLAVLLFWHFGLRYETIILAAALIGFTALIPLIRVREKRRKGILSPFRLSMKELPSSFRKYVAIATFFAFGNFTYMFFILMAKETLPTFAGIAPIVLALMLYAWFNVVYTTFAIPGGILSDRVGRTPVLIAGYLTFGLACLGFLIFSSLPAFILIFAIYGLSYAFLVGNQRALASDLVDERTRATALGVFHAAISLAALPASLIAGLLWEVIAPEMAFVYGATIAFVSAIMLIALRRSIERR